MENLNDPIGNRTRRLPAFSAVPQPTAPLLTQRILEHILISWKMLYQPTNMFDRKSL
jgi:hypothetical protein